MGFNGDLMGFIRIYDGTFYPMTDPNGAAFFLVLHGFHPYTPVMLAYIPAPWILWVLDIYGWWWF